MKKAGFLPKVAGGVEPAASTGDQLMPPIMGVAALVIAQMLMRPYREIIIAAVIPAILYLTSIYVFIDHKTKRLGLAGLPKEMLPPLNKLMKKIYLLAPISVITYVLLIRIDLRYAVIASISSAFLAAIYASETLTRKDKAILAGLLVILAAIILGLGVTASTIEQQGA